MKYRFEIDKRLIGLNEIWKDIEGYEGLYQISNLGRIRSLDVRTYQRNKFGKFQYVLHKGKVLKAQKQRNGYLTIDLHRKGQFKRQTIHRLVAEAFIPNNDNNKYINHKDNDILNNKVSNLEWCTQKYNIKYAYDYGNKIPPNMRSINQIDNNGNIIATFISMQEAERKTNIRSANISKCCRKLRSRAGGYKWEYTE